jgi:uncharacterized protein YecE (DUF72 family)
MSIGFQCGRHGCRHDYTKEDLDLWAKRINDCGAGTVWAYFNNDRNGPQQGLGITLAEAMAKALF